MSSFSAEKKTRSEALARDAEFERLSQAWFDRSVELGYSYTFEWFGRPIIQYPQDMVATQELIWQVKPDLIVETGIAHGGSLIYYASLLKAMDIPDAKVVGVDIEIRPHNRVAIEEHPLFGMLDLIEGSSTAPDIVAQVAERVGRAKRVMVMLDSNHSHSHVLDELRLYSGFVSPGSWLIVFDTCVETMDARFSANRPWAPGNSPLTAVREFLTQTDEFVVDEVASQRLGITVCPFGYLQRRGVLP